MYSNQLFLGGGSYPWKVVGNVHIEYRPLGVNNILVDVPAECVDGKKLTYFSKHSIVLFFSEHYFSMTCYVLYMFLCHF